MDNTVYKTPDSEVGLKKEEQVLTRAEQLAQSRKDIEEVGARGRLNFVWGVRFFCDVCILTVIAIVLYSTFASTGSISRVAIYITSAFALIYVIEILAIIAYFNKKGWSLIALHLFSAISLLNFPFGTIMSVIHYLNAGKMQFDR